MSTVWRGPEVLWREPRRAVAMRVVRHGVTAAVAIGLFVYVPWAWLRISLAIVGVIALFLLILAVANLVRTRRALLVVMGTGSIERPLSIQEGWLRRPKDEVLGSTITVTVAPIRVRAKASEPRVTLSGEGQIKGIPLHHRAPEDFVSGVNKALSGRGVQFVLAGPAADA